MSSLRLDWCSHEAAKYAAEHWHYSGQMPNQKTVKIGVWEDGVFVGAVVFGDGANAGMFKPYGLDYTEGCELVRVALSKHRAPVSRIVSIAIAMLHRAFPKLRLVISFADPEHGHIGGIYQAGNWVYAGRSAASDEYIVNNVRIHGRALRSTRSTHRLRNLKAGNVMDWAKEVLDSKIVRVAGSSKYRYLMPLDAAMRAQILPLAQPYPRRQSLESETPANPGGNEGAAMRPDGSKKMVFAR